jgi:hypothetical protein
MVASRLALVVLLAAGCFDPQVQSGRLLCSMENTCPSGFDCISGRCWTHGTGPDMTTPAFDMTMPPVLTTVHAIDSNMVPSGTRVQLTRVVVTATEGSVSNTAMLSCLYTLFVEDPAAPAPNGIQLHAFVHNCMAGDGGQCTCPAKSGTPLDRLVIGDRITVVGTFVSDSATTPPAHFIQPVDSIVIVNSTTVTPFVITDAALFAPGGTGYATYENMLVAIQPAGGVTIAADDAAGNFSAAGVTFANFYVANWNGGAPFPAVGAHYSSIIGVVGPARNAIFPRMHADFVP